MQITKNFTVQELVGKEQLEHVLGGDVKEAERYIIKHNAGSLNTKIFVIGTFTVKLQNFRNAFNHPMIITSGIRTPEWNKKIGGTPTSFHVAQNPRSTGWCAVDVSTRGWDDDLIHKLIYLAGQHGWTVGVYERHIHLDLRSIFATEPEHQKQFIFEGNY